MSALGPNWGEKGKRVELVNKGVNVWGGRDNELTQCVHAGGGRKYSFYPPLPAQVYFIYLFIFNVMFAGRTVTAQVITKVWKLYDASTFRLDVTPADRNVIKLIVLFEEEEPGS